MNDDTSGLPRQFESDRHDLLQELLMRRESGTLMTDELRELAGLLQREIRERQGYQHEL